MLTTVVVAFAALAALVLTGQAGIRQDVRALQTVMLAGQAELRNEMLAGQAGLRKEMQTGQAELREEMQTGQGELRNEMRAGQAELRKDIRALQVEMRAGQAEPSRRTGRTPGGSGSARCPARGGGASHGCARFPICGGGAANDRMARGRRCSCCRCRFARFARFARRTASWGDSFEEYILKSHFPCLSPPNPLS